MIGSARLAATAGRSSGPPEGLAPAGEDALGGFGANSAGSRGSTRTSETPWTPSTTCRTVRTRVASSRASSRSVSRTLPSVVVATSRTISAETTSEPSRGFTTVRSARSMRCVRGSVMAGRRGRCACWRASENYPRRRRRPRRREPTRGRRAPHQPRGRAPRRASRSGARRWPWHDHRHRTAVRDDWNPPARCCGTTP